VNSDHQRKFIKPQGAKPAKNQISEKVGLELNNENLELLEEVSDFNLEARYPDDKFSFYKKSTMEFTKNKLKQIEGLKKWLLQKLQSSI
jgi:nucleoid-associated protein YejK